jgi:hypothetical protein
MLLKLKNRRNDSPIAQKVLSRASYDIRRDPPRLIEALYAYPIKLKAKTPARQVYQTEKARPIS